MHERRMSFIRLSIGTAEAASAVRPFRREYEVMGEQRDILAITLFRNVGFLGREKLLRRPGRPSGIRLETPDSQMIGEQIFELALAENSDPARCAKEYTTPVITWNKMPYNAMKLNPPAFAAPYEYSLFSVDSRDFIMTACKKAENQEGLVVRGYQSGQELLQTDCRPLQGYALKAEINLNEEELHPLNGQELLTVPKNCVRSYLLTREGS